MTRRSLLGAPVAATVVRRSVRAQSRTVIRIGVINDQSGPYRDVNGPSSIACTRQAIQEFGAGSFDVEVLTADHQNKPDVGTAITRQWIDQLLRLDKLSYDAHMIADRFPQRGMFDVKAPGSIGVGGEAH